MDKEYARLSDRIAELEFEHFQLTMNFNREFALVREGAKVSHEMNEYCNRIAEVEEELDRLHLVQCDRIARYSTFDAPFEN